MYTVVSEHVFPFLRNLGGEDSTYSHHMKDARFTIPTPALLAKVVDLIDHVSMEERDTNGDLYEYMLGKIASAGQNGQFRTPRHIIRLMVEMVAPTPTDVVCDPACGTCGFLVAVGEYLRLRHPELFADDKLRQHFHRCLFHGFDFDNTMLRIGSMNMLLHGIENPEVVYRDSLSQDHSGEEEKYTLVLANPPFAGSLDYENTAKDLLQVVKTKKTELLFVALFMRLLKTGGRAAVIVPDGVLFGSSNGRTRYIPLNSVALVAFRVLKRRSLDGVGPVFVTIGGEPLQGYKHWFEPAVSEAGVRDFTWYCLRHTFASRLAMAGVDLRTVAELMGHQQIQMTMRYAHLAPAHTLAAVERLVTAPQAISEAETMPNKPSATKTATSRKQGVLAVSGARI
jgi:hypothetical protein